MKVLHLRLLITSPTTFKTATHEINSSPSSLCSLTRKEISWEKKFLVIGFKNFEKVFMFSCSNVILTLHPIKHHRLRINKNYLSLLLFAFIGNLWSSFRTTKFLVFGWTTHILSCRSKEWFMNAKLQRFRMSGRGRLGKFLHCWFVDVSWAWALVCFLSTGTRYRGSIDLFSRPFVQFDIISVMNKKCFLSSFCRTRSAKLKFLLLQNAF